MTVGSTLTTASNSDSTLAAALPPGVANEWARADVTAAFDGNLGAGNVLRLIVGRDPTHATDTNGDDIYFHGLLFTYTANT